MKTSALLLALLLLLSPLTRAQNAPAGRPETGFLKRTVTVGSRTYAYRVYVPEDYKPGKAYPVVMYLHGVGEWGQDNEQQMGHGLGSVIQLYSHKQPERFGAFLAVFPQVAAPELWFGEGAEQALKALDQTVAEFKADPSRLYLTGLSLGGYGTWCIAAQHPGKFAAIAPMAGGVLVPSWFDQAFPSPSLTAYKTQPLYTYAATAKALGSTPVWVFHGAKDEVVPVAESRQMVAALKAAGHAAKYTEYPAEGHFIIDNVYTDATFWQWLLAQKLPTAPANAAASTKH
ncbi:prolyl oligopeptidase family serine peptidase [Hymenobacter negativus]|uniref:Prolyl oligopeptidase family serine peptidase n=1 Tax=Hymenobacter negativus TaxID=2795026 RepID=A0ABS3QI22_9BACT|nr:YqiA/YcfP family alpha/beta fold hydrolase [Hymenobacter negativus]MBO2010807.1 prolyl oligopeptidase family serine peptidase [Hymenobacter negativus]